MIIELTNDERKLVNYALNFLKANVDEDNLDSLKLSELDISNIVIELQKKLGIYYK